MKIRHGFVSNSSSSSFVVAFNHVPETTSELQKLLFGIRDFINIYGEDVSTYTIAATVMEDLKKQKPVSEKKIISEVQSGWFPGHPDYDFTGEEREDYWKECNDKGEKLAKRFVKTYKDSKFFIFEYSDNRGVLETAMEHGDIFSNLPNIRISHH